MLFVKHAHSLTEPYKEQAQLPCIAEIIESCFFIADVERNTETNVVVCYLMVSSMLIRHFRHVIDVKLDVTNVDLDLPNKKMFRMVAAR